METISGLSVPPILIDAPATDLFFSGRKPDAETRRAVLKKKARHEQRIQESLAGLVRDALDAFGRGISDPIERFYRWSDGRGTIRERPRYPYRPAGGQAAPVDGALPEKAEELVRADPALMARVEEKARATRAETKLFWLADQIFRCAGEEVGNGPAPAFARDRAAARGDGGIPGEGRPVPA
ncbi:MAG: hypothetical protein ACK5JR_05410 [Tropicimonas sp.]|uniref:hypothetical protein n=1 Tax=Tropicimonas sp. TaxID=2067044 RepID=UPI003A870DEC